MARKFLYIVAALVVLVLVGLAALSIWGREAFNATFVPTRGFEVQAPLAADAYADPAMWFSGPQAAAAGNPALWLPQGATEAGAEAGAVVFFVHPTSYFSTDHWNSPKDDAEARDEASGYIRVTASAFSATGKIWAPKYRQATFGSFLSDSPESAQALEVAYGDVLLAFDHFLAHVPADAPIVLAAHSQGSFHLKRLMRDRVAGKPLASRIAAAYPIGWQISLRHDLPKMGLPACASPDQPGCVVNWLSFAQPAESAMMDESYAIRPALDGAKPGGSAFLCSNPLTGAIGGAAPAGANSGTLVPDAELANGRLQPGMVPARCGGDGYLDIGPPPELGPYVLPGNNYHVYDVPLFWANLRSDAARRVSAWKVRQ